MPQQKFFDWTTLIFHKDEFAQRRQRMMAQLAPDGGIFITPSRHHLSDGSTFRQLDDFLYGSLWIPRR